MHLLRRALISCCPSLRAHLRVAYDRIGHRLALSHLRVASFFGGT